MTSPHHKHLLRMYTAISAGATGNLQDLDVRLLRPGLNGGVSGNGLFYP